MRGERGVSEAAGDAPDRIEADKPKSIRDRAIAGTGWMVGFRLFSRLLGLAGTLIVARLLIPADFGVVAVASTITAATDSLTDVGVQDSLIRFKGNPIPLYNAGFTIQMVRAALSALVLVIVAQFVDQWFGERRLEPVLLVLAGVYALGGLENIGVVEFRRQLRFNSEFKLSAVPRIAGFLTTAAAAVLLHSYWALVLGIAVQKLARLIYSYWAHPYRPRFGLHGWRELAGVTFWTWMSALGYIVWNRSDAIIIGSALGATKLGMIVMASDIAQLPTTEFLYPAGAVLFTALAAARNDGADIITRAFPIAAMLLFTLAPLAIIASALSGDIVSLLLGQRWSDAQGLVAIFAWLGLFGPFTYVSSVALTADSRLKLNFTIVIVSSLVKIALLSLAVRTGDIRLVALASIGTAAAEGMIFITVLCRQGATLSPVVWTVARTFMACLVCVGAMALTGSAWRPQILPPVMALLHAVGVGGLGFVCYWTTMIGSWRLAGSPAGPEADLLAIVRVRLARFSRPSVVPP